MSLPLTAETEQTGSTASEATCIRIYCFRIDSKQSPENSSYPFSVYERERAALFAKSILSHRYLESRRILRNLLGKELGIDPQEVEFEYNECGKPFLANDRAASLHFNLSHSENFLLIAICRDTPVGIDLERNRKLPDEAEIVNGFFHPGERDEYLSVPEPLRTQAFINAWTRKEAVIKAIGTGLSTPLDSFQVSLDPRLPARLATPPNVRILESDKNWYLYSFHPFEDTTAAVAIPHANARIEFSNRPF